MDLYSEIYDQIANTFSAHFECVYYVDIKTGHYIVFAETDPAASEEFPNEGDDFFADAVKNADKFIHPDDLNMMYKAYDKERILKSVSSKGTCIVTFRSTANGKITHMRHLVIRCKDNEHILCCLENIEEEFQEKDKQKKDLQSAERMARRDELTGIKNSNAFKEYTDAIEGKVDNGEIDRLGVVMCDVNDLKLINDTRGHAYGDEAIRATSRLICETFEHSPVFRIGGDEFVAVLTGRDYEQKDTLLNKLRQESEGNRRARSGPVVASGLAILDDSDKRFSDILRRADRLMYENKKDLKAARKLDGFRNMDLIDTPIPAERKRLLDGLFGALVTIAGGGYIFLDDMRYDFSRWAMSLIDDFGLESEYMYHADRIWKNYIHPDDLEIINNSITHILNENGELEPIKYRARRKDGTYVFLYTRGFILTDSNGEPEYFGGIICEV